MSKITVRLGQLTQALRTSSVKPETPLVTFLEGKGFTYGSAVRVNGGTVNRNYVLRNGDVVTVIEDIEGGK